MLEGSHWNHGNIHILKVICPFFGKSNTGEFYSEMMFQYSPISVVSLLNL